MINTEPKKINSEIRVHELHHHVLVSWAELKKDLPSVITFDHHTDILKAFSRYCANNPYPADAGEELTSDIELLQHDEHFDYAIKYNLISSALIVSHTPAVTEVCKNLQVLYNGDFAEDEPLNSEKFRRYADCALEDDFLEQFLPYFPQENYILDIDCDYFKTEKSLKPAKNCIFRSLMRNARMVTFSREADWVRLLTFENMQTFTPEYIIDCLCSN